MTERIWFNGRAMAMAEAHVSVEDRGFQFADGVYEVVKLYAGKPFALDAHLARLEKSAAGIELAVPLPRAKLAGEIRQFLQGAGEGYLYLQLTRGAGPRNHLFPHLCNQPKIEPTLLFYWRTTPAIAALETSAGVKLVTAPDERWQRCWIKSIALLPNVLAKSAAVAQGADEACFLDNGAVTECSASNIFGVVNGKLVTHPVGKKVLGGITRDAILPLARGLDIGVEERPWTHTEAQSASELFITSTTREISWVSHFNNMPIKPGKCGPVAQRISTALRGYIASNLARG